MNATAIAMSSYSVVPWRQQPARPRIKNQATMTPKAWISTGDSSLCGHLRRSDGRLLGVPGWHRSPEPLVTGLF